MQKRNKPSRVLKTLAVVAIVGVSLSLSWNIYKQDKSTAGEVLSATSQLSTVVNPGTLSTDIVNSSFVTVASPSFPMSTGTTSFSCQTVTGTFGTNTNRIYVSNPDAAGNGWNLTIAANAPTETWSDGSGHTFNFNNAAGSGCTGGQLTIDPTTGTIFTGQCTNCATTNVTKGASASFVNGTTNTITLMSASSNADHVADYYLTGVSLSQKVPASTFSGTYTINLVLTVTAL